MVHFLERKIQHVSGNGCVRLLRRQSTSCNVNKPFESSDTFLHGICGKA